MSITNPAPQRAHLILGAFGLLAFLVLIVIDALPQYDVSDPLAAMLVGSYLILLGFGALVSQYIEARYD